MDGLDRWDAALLAGAVIAATWKLAAMMTARRNRLVADVQRQLDQQREWKREAEQAAKGAA